MTIQNPILPGFNPDPSLCRVGDDFYIATSTFEWFPGVQIWHSRDLTEWTLVRRPLDRPVLLRMEGIQSSGGVWAPCLTYDGERFHLVYTVVRTWRGEASTDRAMFKDTHNYLTTSPTVKGPWSDPVYLNSTGFDPSLFHHQGRKYLLNMEWDHRMIRGGFTGILLQEYSPEEGRLVGPVSRIFPGTSLGMTEGPHLYHREGWFYLFTAEGGTGYGHAATVARSRELLGPYELHPETPILGSVEKRPEDLDAIDRYRDDPRSNPAPEGFHERPQKAGHASICPLDGDEWALVHLSGRPYPGGIRCPLGRETSIQRVVFRDAWPFVVGGDRKPIRLAAARTCFDWSPRAGAKRTDPARMLGYRSTDREIVDEFDGPELHPAFRFLRRHPGSDLSLTARPGYLRLMGRESPVSPFVQTVVGMSVTHFDYRVRTTVEFEPASPQQMAGLLVRYDERNQYYLRIAGDGEGGRTLGLFRAAGGRVVRPEIEETPLRPGPVEMVLDVQGAVGRFSWTADGARHAVGAVLDMLQLSDEAAVPLGFTGTFVCLACHDLTGGGIHADFGGFSYSGR